MMCSGNGESASVSEEGEQIPRSTGRNRGSMPSPRVSSSKYPRAHPSKAREYYSKLLQQRCPRPPCPFRCFPTRLRATGTAGTGEESVVGELWFGGSGLTEEMVVPLKGPSACLHPNTSKSGVSGPVALGASERKPGQNKAGWVLLPGRRRRE